MASNWSGRALPDRAQERVQLAFLVSGIRWAGFALAAFEALFAEPKPVSVPLAVAVTVAMGLYNVPAAFARRLPAAWVERVLLGGLVGDFLVVTSWLLLSANDPQDLTFTTYFLVAVEASVIFQFTATIPFSAAAVAAIGGAWAERTLVFHIQSDPGNLVLRWAVVVIAAVFLGKIAETSERRRADALDKSARNEALHIVASRLSQTLKQGYVLDTVVESLARIYPDRWHGILLRSESGTLEVRHVRGEPEHISFEIKRPRAYESGPIIFDDIRTDERMARIRSELPEELFQFAGGVVVPMRMPDRLFGVLAAFDRRPGAFKADDVEFLESLAGHASLALENARLYEEVQMLSLTDATTTLFNRRAFDLRLRDELERAARYKVPLSLLMVDVDHFKLYNDTHGHPAGDRVLRALGSVLAGSQLRSTDTAFRFGGEEFAVIMPHTDAAAAVISAERVRAAVAEAPFPDGTDQPLGHITVSIGVASYPMQAADARELVEHADLALYDAKRLGRDCVRAFQPQLKGEPTPAV